MEDALPGKFPVSLEIPVAWGDMDSFGHVNNVVFLRWCESARIAYFDRTGITEKMKAEKIGPILARACLDYRRPVTYPDIIRASATVTQIGKTSFVMRYRLFSLSQATVAGEGDSVIVMIDYRSGEKVPVDAELRRTIAALERIE
jgi:acyl-CoA thioester hydrolase